MQAEDRIVDSAKKILIVVLARCSMGAEVGKQPEQALPPSS
jgi:hypothetical protein